jgi:hypothetical protein
MKTDRETTRAVRSWLEEGSTRLPDRVLDEVLDRVPAVRQRRARWRIRNFQVTRSLLPVVVAAVVIFAVLGVTTVSPRLNVAGPAQPATPRALPAYPADLAPGTYVIDDPFPVRATIEVPDGWESCIWGPHELGPCASSYGRGVALYIVDNVVADPCDPSRAQLDPPVGPSVDDLVAAISALPGFDATEPIAINVDGFSGQQFELTAPASPGCNLATWSTKERVNGMSPSEVNLIRIVDVDGVRVLIAAAYQPATTTPQQLDELRQVMDSIRIGP